ncbi:hypothetical protein J1N35_005885 [Gossypium stocksii]|uniref:Uncharacterized protein n=1 Tax=Gossypium stocksii TaxID=47602 RepID=A0A9D3WG60_9ROSI|nr:hypothetical protein J1N35_005885 [Gossypium stocksii]
MMQEEACEMASSQDLKIRVAPNRVKAHVTIQRERWSVKFGNENEELIYDKEDNDLMVVLVTVAGFEVKRILVDSGNTVEVLSWDV